MKTYYEKIFLHNIPNIRYLQQQNNELATMGIKLKWFRVKSTSGYPPLFQYNSISIQQTTTKLRQRTAKQSYNMELRKVEQELDALSSDWKELRRKRPQFDDKIDNELCSSTNIVLSNIMPTWKELKSRVKDDEIFPSEDVDVKEEQDIMNDTDMKDDEKDTNVDTTDAPNSKEEDIGYSEFGMCLASTDNGEADKAEKKEESKPNMFERYAAKTVSTEKNVLPQQQPTTNDDEEEEEQIVTQEEALPPQDVLSAFESLNERFTALKPKIDKFMAKLKDVSI